jgi:hypothetical protein
MRSGFSEAGPFKPRCQRDARRRRRRARQLNMTSAVALRLYPGQLAQVP